MSVPHYDPQAPLHCPSCGTGLRAAEVCPWPGCARYGRRADEARSLDGDDALAILERRALLDYLEVAGELIEIEHRERS